MSGTWGEEILGEEEKDCAAEILIVDVLSKCAVKSYMWDMVLGGTSDGSVPSIATIKNLLARLWRDQGHPC